MLMEAENENYMVTRVQMHCEFVQHFGILNFVLFLIIPSVPFTFLASTKSRHFSRTAEILRLFPEMLFSILGPDTAVRRVVLFVHHFMFLCSVCPIARLFTGMKDFCSYNKERCVWGPKSGAPFWYTGLVNVVWSREGQEQDQQRCVQGEKRVCFSRLGSLPKSKDLLLQFPVPLILILPRWPLQHILSSSEVPVLLH